MPDTIMDRISEKQKSINQCRSQALELYPALWSNIITEWNRPDAMDRAWLTYSANYLFRTNNIRWAIDPLTLGWRVKGTPSVDVARDLSGLAFVLLTHEHRDHLDLELLAALRHAPIQWVVPDFILSKVIGQAGLPRENIMIPVPLHPIEFNGIQILPFEGLHWEMTSEGNRKGVPAMGYRIECNRRRWLFPGDTRTYDTSQLPAFDSIDVLFAHLWLGRGYALMEEAPLRDSFCRFCLELQPGRIILTHLYEFGREAIDFWDETHVRAVSSKFQGLRPGLPVQPAYMGNEILLEDPLHNDSASSRASSRKSPS